MAWTNSGALFQIFDQHDVAVTSVAHAGVAALPAGRAQLKVDAAGPSGSRQAAAGMPQIE
jgi:hypothetical protein